MHNKIKLRLKAGNRCYFAMPNLCKSKLMSNKTKESLYSTYIKPVVSYAYTWTTTAGDEKRLNIFERIMDLYITLILKCGSKG